MLKEEGCAGNRAEVGLREPAKAALGEGSRWRMREERAREKGVLCWRTIVITGR
jgi:hypothetical protein